jgi:hypothetical protein
MRAALDLPDQEALESLITDAIYAELIDGALDPQNEIVHINNVSPIRDLKPGSSPELLKHFEAWTAKCNDELFSIQKAIELIDNKAKAKAQRDLRIQQIFDENLENVGKPSGQAGGKSQNDEMDVDEPGPNRARPSRRTAGRRLGNA